MGMQDEIRTAVKWDIPSVNLDDSLRVVINRMVEHKASALVVKKNDDVVGVVSDVDLLRSLIDKKNMDEAKVSEYLSPCELIGEKGTRNPCAQLDNTESVENALKVIEIAGTHNLLVSGSDKNEVGMVSIHALLEVAIS